MSAWRIVPFCVWGVCGSGAALVLFLLLAYVYFGAGNSLEVGCFSALAGAVQVGLYVIARAVTEFAARLRQVTEARY